MESMVVCARSEKELIVDFPYEVRTSPNFVHDKRLFALQGITTYPKIIYLDDGEVAGHDEINFVSADDVFRRVKPSHPF